MAHNLPDIILLPIPFIFFFSYLKQVESYITMFKKCPKLLTGIIIVSLIIFVVGIVCNANWVITNCTDASPSGQSDINAFEGINALFAGLGSIGIFYTLLQQAKNLHFVEKGHNESLRLHEYNDISHEIDTFKQMLHSLNETHRTNENSTDSLSEHIYNKISKNFEELKSTYNDNLNPSDKYKLKMWIYNQINLHTQPLLQIIYTMRSIFSSIDNAEHLTDTEIVRLRDSLFFSISHFDYKVLQLVYIRKSMWINYGKNKHFNEYFSEDTARLIISQSTNTHSESADNFIYNTLKDADPRVETPTE